MAQLSYRLAEGFGSLRHALSGGTELALDAGADYQTDDPREIAALDAHPAAERVKKPSAAAAATAEEQGA